MNFQETLVVTSPHSKVTNLNFPGSPIVKNLHFQCRSASPIPRQGNKDPTRPMAQPKKNFFSFIFISWRLITLQYCMKLNKGHNLLSIYYVSNKIIVSIFSSMHYLLYFKMSSHFR